MSKTTSELRIYVACLACYNSGRLVGEWIDAAQGADAIAEDVAEMMKHDTHGDPCPHEECAIHDFEMGGAKLNEYDSFAHVAKLAECIERHGDAFVAWFDYETREADDDWGEQFEEVYRGEFDSEAEYAEQFADDVGLLRDVPENLRGYFDFKSYGRDLFMDGLWSVPAGGGRIYVFENS